MFCLPSVRSFLKTSEVGKFIVFETSLLDAFVTKLYAT